MKSNKSSIDKFLSHVRSLGLEWELEDGGVISMKGEELCPIWAVYRETDEADIDADYGDYADDAYDAGQRIGLDKASIRAIMAAADNSPHQDSTLRTRLLEATGLLTA